MADEEMQKRTWSGLMEFSLKHRVVRDFRRFLRILLPWLDIVGIEAEEEFGTLVLRYVVHDMDDMDKQIFIEETNQHVNPKIGETTMTLAEQFREEGLENGLEKGRKETLKAIALTMLKKDMPVESISELTGLTTSAIKELQTDSK